MPMFATRKVRMDQIILFVRNRKLAFVFQRWVVKFCEWGKNFDFRCWATPIIIIVTLMPMLTLQHPELRCNTLLWPRKPWISILKEPFFSGASSSFDGCSVRIKGESTSQSGKIFDRVIVTNVCVWLVKYLFCLVNQTCHWASKLKS